MEKDEIEAIIKIFVDKYDFSGGHRLGGTFEDEYSKHNWKWVIERI